MDEKKLIIEPKLTADLHGFGSPTGRLRVQAQLYARGIFESYHGAQPMPAGVINDQAICDAEDALLRHYSSADVAFTLGWWNRMYGKPVLVNRLTRAEYQSYNDLVRPETLAAMARPFEPRLFAYPDFGGGLYR